MGASLIHDTFTAIVHTVQLQYVLITRFHYSVNPEDGPPLSTTSELTYPDEVKTRF